MTDLRELWALPLEAQQASRVYLPRGLYAGEETVGRFALVKRSDGQTAIADSRRPWNDAIVGVHKTHGKAKLEAERMALLRPGSLLAE